MPHLHFSSWIALGISYSNSCIYLLVVHMEWVMNISMIWVFHITFRRKKNISNSLLNTVFFLCLNFPSCISYSDPDNLRMNSFSFFLISSSFMSHGVFHLPTAVIHQNGPVRPEVTEPSPAFPERQSLSQVILMLISLFPLKLKLCDLYFWG